MRFLRRQKAWDLAIVAAVVALGGAALADALRGGATTEEGQESRAPSPLTTTGEASPPRLPGVGSPGLVAFTAPGACELRAFDLRSGRKVEVPRLATTCELWAPRVGRLVAYRVPDDLNGATMHFRVLDLEHPKAGSREYRGFGPIAWRPDGSRLAWCDTPQSGFELSLGQRPERLDHCHRGGHLVGATSLPASTPDYPPRLAPDNCAALSVRAPVVRLIDLGCFRGRAPRTFNGVYADWSPNGGWIAVAERDAVVFHRVVGGEASVRWSVAVGQLAWVGA